MANDEMNKYFRIEIQKAKQMAAEAEVRVKKLEKSYLLFQEAAQAGEMRRTIPPKSEYRIPPSQGESRQKVAPLIRGAVESFLPGEPFTVADVFKAIPEDGLDYERTRPSISAWLKHYIEEAKVEKIGRGVYATLDENEEVREDDLE